MDDELDDGAPDDGEDEEEGGKHRRVPLPVKVVVIGALWVLLVVFLAGVFSSEDDGTVELDQANGTNVQLDSIDDDDDGSSDDDDEGDDDSSTIEEGEARPLSRGGSTASGSVGSTSGGTSSGTGSSSGGTGGTSGGSETTTPDEQPVAGGGSSSSTTAPRSTTSTTKKPTTSSSTTTTTTTSTTQQPTYAKTVELDRDDNEPEFSPSSITIKKGQSVRFLNKDTTHTHTLHFGDNDQVILLTPDDEEIRQFNTIGTFTVNCTTPGHHGNLSVKVEA